MATSQERLGMNLKKCIQRLRKVANRGPSHKARLENIDEKIVVTGTRGKSGATRWLYEILYGRGRDAFAKITGNRPLVLHDGESNTLYENISLIAEFVPELDAYEPDDVAIFENQGITEYTTRLFNQRLTDPDIIVLTNVRQDHTDTLGKTRTDCPVVRQNVPGCDARRRRTASDSSDATEIWRRLMFDRGGSSPTAFDDGTAKRFTGRERRA